MRKFLAVLGSLFLLAAWSLPEAAEQANRTLVTVGEWCSGTIISENKVVTAAHCLPDIRQNSHRAQKGQPYGYKFFEPVIVTRHIFGPDGTEIGRIGYKAVVYKYDYKNDVAILANVSGYKFESWVRVNTTPVHYGDKVYAVGNPRMWYNTVSEGRVMNPKVVLQDGSMIMFDAPIAPGSSGGGLFNDKGELIGITNQLMPGSVFGFANTVDHMVELLND